MAIVEMTMSVSATRTSCEAQRAGLRAVMSEQDLRVAAFSSFKSTARAERYQVEERAVVTGNGFEILTQSQISLLRIGA
ncbi:MAG: hypothetical protein JWN03_8306 [Nocardia sp.]|uniref:hypothetical protein n=1 Tax=Nocardia sp. TaxID=1821 RepID=UPI00261B9F6A|nr:hypothetical protein [Nocardia sp.]MCU1648031.1 hypothetical protein [Nocardia sp.]